MGEPKTPPLAGVTDPQDLRPAAPASPLADLPWPPPGWPMFSCVNRMSGRAARSNSARSATYSHQDDDYLTYAVTGDRDGIYTVEILAGTLARTGATTLTPALGIRFAAREDWFDENPGAAVVEIHVGGQRLIPERGAILRTILALTFVISRIDRGIAPSLRRVLKTYRLA